jgi:hypothetical protein
MLYLELAQLPIKNVIAVRRILYLHNILGRPDNELVKRIYYAMKNDPLKGDWINQVTKDMDEINLHLSDQEIQSYSKVDFKQLVKTKMRNHVFSELQNIKADHSKVKNIVHTDLNNPQKYLTSGLLSNTKSSLLFNLRCMSVNEFKSNTESSDQHSPCPTCKNEDDTQEHSLVCIALKTHMSDQDTEFVQSVSYSDLFGSVDAQLLVVEAFSLIIKTREKLRKVTKDSLPGQNTGPDSI